MVISLTENGWLFSSRSSDIRTLFLASSKVPPPCLLPSASWEVSTWNSCFFDANLFPFPSCSQDFLLCAFKALQAASPHAQCLFAWSLQFMSSYRKFSYNIASTIPSLLLPPLHLPLLPLPLNHPSLFLWKFKLVLVHFTLYPTFYLPNFHLF